MRNSSALKGIVALLVALLLVSATGCNLAGEAKSSSTPVGTTITVTDSIGREVEVPATVKRIGTV